LVVALLPVGAVPLFSLGFLHQLQRPLCPATTLVWGHLSGAGVILGASGLDTGLLLLAVTLGGTADVRLRITPKQWQRLALLALGVAMVAISAPAFGLDFFNVYCATPQAIEVRQPFRAPLAYRWTDVTRVASSCTQQRTLSIDLNIDLADGRTLDFGGDSWDDTHQNYHAIGALLANADYDNSGADDCPDALQQLFANRPG
jgi:hypothetical protein